MTKKRLVIATSLFIDIVDSIELANYWDPQKYNDFLNEFQDRMLTGIDLWGRKRNIKDIKISGDELLVIYCSKDISEDIVNAISLSTNLKLLWYISSTNLKRIKEGKKILDLGIGINTGKVMIDNRPYKKGIDKFISKRKTLEGFALSLAKRIETFSREGKYSKIMVGHNSIAEFNKLFHNYEFEYRGLQNLKGLSQEMPIFELKSCYTETAETIGNMPNLKWIIRQLENIKIYDPSNIWLHMTLIDIYSNQENYKKVEQLCKEAITIDGTVANVYSELAAALAEQKQYNESLQFINKAILLRPNLWYLYAIKSSVLIFLGLFDQCIDTCKFVINHAPKWSLKEGEVYYYHIAAAYARKGDVGNALNNIKKAIKIGGKKTIQDINKDEDNDFYNLYDNPEFKKICKGALKTTKRKVNVA